MMFGGVLARDADIAPCGGFTVRQCLVRFQGAGAGQGHQAMWCEAVAAIFDAFGPEAQFLGPEFGDGGGVHEVSS